MATVPEEVISATDSLDAAQQQQQSAQAGLTSAISDFNPPTNTAPATFDTPQPTDQWNSIVGMSPLLVAMGAIGGVFGRAHGIAMIQSTNAMMKGLVQGDADQYADARKQYETKYQQWQDQQRTWNDTYKAYMQAYKGRIDAQQRAVQGANAAVGIAQKNAAMTQKQVEDSQKLQLEVAKLHEKIKADDAKEVTDTIRAQSDAARAAAAAKEADIRLQQLKEKAKTADANTLTATSRSIKAEYDSIIKQYPPSGDKRPAEIDAKLKGLRDQMDLVNEKLEEHTQSDYNQNKAAYDEARNAIKRGADPNIVKSRLAAAGLNPDSL